METEITNANLQSLLEGDKPVMIDFWAEWCGPCRMLMPVVEELAAAYDGKIVIGKCNVDEQSEVTEQFKIRNIPTLLFFKNGQLVDKLVGSASKQAVETKLQSLLSL